MNSTLFYFLLLRIPLSIFFVAPKTERHLKYKRRHLQALNARVVSGSRTADRPTRIPERIT